MYANASHQICRAQKQMLYLFVSCTPDSGACRIPVKSASSAVQCNAMQCHAMQCIVTQQRVHSGQAWLCIRLITTDAYACAGDNARLTCSAGLMVLAVVEVAPETMPSASPARTMRVPYTLMSCKLSLACCSVMPLFFLALHRIPTYLSRLFCTCEQHVSATDDSFALYMDSALQSMT